MLNESNQPTAEKMNSVIEWDLYEFFQAPGIYYESDDGTRKKCYYGSGPSMRPDLYGYRLGTREEVDKFEKLKQKKK